MYSYFGFKVEVVVVDINLVPNRLKGVVVLKRIIRVTAFIVSDHKWLKIGYDKKQLSLKNNLRTTELQLELLGNFFVPIIPEFAGFVCGKKIPQKSAGKKKNAPTQVSHSLGLLFFIPR